MDFTGLVGRQIAVVTDDNFSPDFQNRIGCQSFAFQPQFSRFVESHGIQFVGVVLTAQWITIRFLDQFCNRAVAVADDDIALATNGRDQPITDNQQPVSRATRKLFDDHAGCAG